MASKHAVRLLGVPESTAAFRALPPLTRQLLLDEAIAPTVRAIAAGARARIVASPSVQTGGLLNHVGIDINASTGRGKVGITSGAGPARVVRSIRRTIAKARRVARPRLDPSIRAHFVEFGTKKMSAEPFMRPAAEEEREPFRQRCQAAVQKAAAQISRQAVTP